MRSSLRPRSENKSCPLNLTVTGEVQIIYSVRLSFNVALSSIGSILISAPIARSPTTNVLFKVSPVDLLI